MGFNSGFKVLMTT